MARNGNTLTIAVALVGSIALACGGEPEESSGNGRPGADQPDGGHGGTGAAGGMAAAGGLGGSGGQGEPWQPVQSAWCGDGYQGIDDGSCFYAPASPNGSVLLFLHGMLPADGSPAGMQAIARAAADEHGFVVLFPRGQQGLCDWDPSVLHWWCWPTSRLEVDTHAAAMVADWHEQVELVGDYLGLDLPTRHVLGFSNGGYFASYLGLEGWWAPLAGAGLVAAGRSFVDESTFGSDRPPIYVAVGALDTEQVQNSAQNLAYVLWLNRWPHDFVLHPASGHELSVGDFSGAWALWTAAD